MFSSAFLRDIVATEPCNSRLRAIRRMGIAFAVMIICLSANPATAAEYLLSPGDTLELSVSGVLREPQKATVGIDGMISFPLVGDVRAAGRTLNDVRSDVRDALTRQPFRRQASDTGASTYSIMANEISLQIVEFRPVYVSGDVLHPGQVSYRPGLTVRQAVAVAGGFGRERSEGRLIELQYKYDRAALDFAKYGLQANSIEVELGRGNNLDNPQAFAGVDPSAVKAMAAAEEEGRAARQQAFDAKRTFLNLALKLSSRRIETLESQVENEQKGADLDAAEVLSVDELFHKGLVPASRLTEVRRSSLLSSSRALQTRIALEDAKRDSSELQSKLNGLDHERKVQLLADLEKANSNMRNAALDMQGARRELSLEGDVSTGVQISIFRNRSDGAHGAIADEDAELLPGDTLEITTIRRTADN